MPVMRRSDGLCRKAPEGAQMAPAASVASPGGYRRMRFAGASTAALPQNGPAEWDCYAQSSARHLCGALMHRSNQCLYSTISSARPLKGSGTVMPSALAVLRLMYSSTFAACWTGSSAGFSPLRIRPV
jgi:hypothetical protein